MRSWYCPTRLHGDRLTVLARAIGCSNSYAQAPTARTWLRIKVDLLGGGGIECEPPPGRIFIVGPEHSFGDLAEAIDAAFARWDLSHLHGFDLADGRKIGSPDPDFFDTWLDERELKVAE